MQTILGSGGTIGTELAQQLNTYTDKIRLVSRNPKAVNSTDELVSADLTNADQVMKAVEGSEVVYLTAGFDYLLKVWQETWPKVMQNVITACEKHGAKLVFFDNVYMYDPNHITHMTEETPINPISKKGKVRAALVQMIMNEVNAGRLMALIARSADFYGPNNDKSFLIEIVHKNFLKGKKANWLADANKKHSFTYTPDAAKATALLGNTPDAYNQVWHLPTDKHLLTGKQWIELFAKEMNLSPNYMVLPKWMIGILGWFVPFMKELHEMLYQYDQDYFFDSSKFEKRFALMPTSYTEGVRRIIKGN